MHQGATGDDPTQGHLMHQGVAAAALVGAAVEARITQGDQIIGIFEREINENHMSRSDFKLLALMYQ